MYTAETAPFIRNDMIGKVGHGHTLPYGHAPCDAYGNPYNEDGKTVQLYIECVESSSAYRKKNYKMKFRN